MRIVQMSCFRINNPKWSRNQRKKGKFCVMMEMFTKPQHKRLLLNSENYLSINMPSCSCFDQLRICLNDNKHVLLNLCYNHLLTLLLYFVIEQQPMRIEIEKTFAKILKLFVPDMKLDGSRDKSSPLDVEVNPNKGEDLHRNIRAVTDPGTLIARKKLISTHGQAKIAKLWRPRKQAGACLWDQGSIKRLRILRGKM